MKIKRIIVDQIPDNRTDCPFCLNEREYEGDSYTCDMNDSGKCQKDECPLVMENEIPPKIEFVSYDGKYPNLCRGTLKITINDVPYELNGILISSGTTDWLENTVTEGDWIINESWLPKELRQYHEQIEKLVNENVEHGCCGGCL